MEPDQSTEMDLLEPPPADYPSTRSCTPTKLTYLPKRPPVDIEFIDLSYTVPTGRGSKLILRNVSGLFRSGHLTAILGPSGAGKSTLLNILAGYKTAGSSGTILTNGENRDMSLFRKLSRYIMQEDLLQQRLTVNESMFMSANLKLGNSQTKAEKLITINEILEMLRLNNCRDTFVARLSGGERKRLSIALELVNNPPVIFLDEPTTGLDDLSSSQCIALLKTLAQGGRTIICSIHTPSAKLFATFDHVYVVSQGACVFQGLSRDIVPFLDTLGLTCPTHYNPADFVIEVSSGEYGNYVEKMTTAIDNGKIYRWCRPVSGKDEEVEPQPVAKTSPLQTKKYEYNFSSSGWSQFNILFYRMMLQTVRDRKYLVIKFTLHLFCALIVGGMFFQFGNDASKTLFNFGFCFLCSIFYLYVPMLPVLLQFPSEVQLLKREYFNRWYGLTSYFFAMTLSRLVPLLLLGSFFAVPAYILTDQPLEWNRLLLFLGICNLIGFVAESFGLVLSSIFNVVNGIFMGPTLSVPLMLLAVYGLGTGTPNIPVYMRLLMHLSFLRYGLEGFVIAIYGYNRKVMPCPAEEDYCHYKDPKLIMHIAGMDNAKIWVDFLALITMFVVFRALTFLILRYRLSTNKRFQALHNISRIIKANFDGARKFS